MESIQDQNNEGNENKVATTPRSHEQIAELFQIASRETDAIRRLSGCVKQLQQAQEAKHTLATLSPGEIRGAIELRKLREAT